MASSTSLSLLPSLGPHIKPQLPVAATRFGSLPTSSASAPRHFGGKQRGLHLVVKAVDSSDSSSESIVEYLQSAWSNSEDRLALAGLGFAGIAAVWASSNLIGAIDKLPVVPGVLEFIGILFSWWFIYRYLLFKPDREELVKNVKASLLDVLGK